MKHTLLHILFMVALSGAIEPTLGAASKPAAPDATRHDRPKFNIEYYKNGTINKKHIQWDGKTVYNELYDLVGHIEEKRVFIATRRDQPFYGESTVHKYYINGQPMSDYFEFDFWGSPQAPKIWYYANGFLKSIENYTLPGDDSFYQISFYSDGQLESFTRKHPDNRVDTISNPAWVHRLFTDFTNRPAPQGKMIDGTPEGHWVYWFSKGHKQYDMNFKDGLLNGLFVAYYTSGRKMCEIQMDDGQKVNYTYYDTHGKVIRTSVPENKKPEMRKLPVWYYDNHNKQQEETYDKTTRKYQITDWYANGKISMQKTNCPDSACSECDVTRWYENGQLQTTYHEGKSVEGFQKKVSYFSNGKKEYENFWDEKNKAEICQSWFENGNKELLNIYTEGRKYRHFNQWNENGILTRDGFYRGEQKDSLWKEYDEKGRLLRQISYKNGVVVSKPEYKQNNYCQCRDSSKDHIEWTFPLSDQISLETLRWYLSPYASADESYKDMYYMYPRWLTSLKPIYMRVPDSSGFKLILNPCPNRFADGVPINVWYHVGYDFLNAQLGTEHVAIEFNPALLHLWNKEASRQVADTEAVDAHPWLYFKCSAIDFNPPQIFEVNSAKLLCFNTCEIGNTGILLNLQEAQIKLNPNEELKNAKDKAATSWYVFNKSLFQSFLGVYAPTATCTLTGALGGPQADAEDVFISNNAICGKITLPVVRGSNHHLFRLKDDGADLSVQELASLLKQKQVQTDCWSYNYRKRTVSFYLNYTLN